jgi:hypothetical protein
MENNGILGEAQGAFRRDRRMEDNIFTLQGICALRKSKKDKFKISKENFVTDVTIKRS